MATKRARALSPRLISLAVASCFVTGSALANPVGHTVVNGQVTVQQMGNLLQVTNSPNAIINWQSFSIGANEITRFLQQSSSSAVLNRVTGAGGAIDPSIILGALQSNGRVFLINPSGIVFGAGSQVDVAGLVASSLNLSNTDFLAGKLKFSDVPGAGSVVNQGNIQAATGGQVYLVGAAVTNSGIIASPNGEVVLAAGKSVELVNPGTPNLRVEVVAADNQARNLGRIVADAGRVGIYAGIINHSGTIRADSAQATDDGRIVLKATRSVTLEPGSVTTANGPQGGKIEIQSGDTTIVAGTVEARGSEGKGGTVHVLGDKVGLLGDASIDASGKTGGGTVLVGGGFQGKDPAIQNASSTIMGSNASIAADAIVRGNGGKVVVWSDDMTRAYGSITARGGKQSGDGGTVEVSSKGWLDFHANVDTSAPKGKTGTLLLDPTNVEIVSTCCGGEGTDGNFSFASAGDPTIFTPDYRPQGNNTPSQITWEEIKNRLVNNHVIITTSDNDGDPGHAGNITVVAASGNFNRSNYLQLVAHHNINVNGSITNSGTGDIRMFAGWIGGNAQNPIPFGDGSINLNAPVSTGGHMFLAAGNAVVQNASAPIRANSLFAFSSFGKVELDKADNMVNTLAGRAATSFKFRNDKSLTIGSTPNGSGIVVDGGEGQSSATIEVTSSNKLTVARDVVAMGDNTGKNATIKLNAGNGGIRVDGAEGVNITARGGDAFVALRTVRPAAAAESGGNATILLNTSGNIELVNNARVTADGGTSNFGDGGNANVTMTADGSISIGGSSQILAVGGKSNVGNGGQSLVQLVSGAGITVNGGAFVVADGGEGHTNGGKAVLDMLAAGNITIAGAEGMGAFGGNGGTKGGAGETTITSSGGSISIDDMRRTVFSQVSDQGRGIFAHGGQGLHEDSTGGLGSLVIATKGSGGISSNASHIDAIGGDGAATGGRGEILVQANSGSISITNGYESDFFPGTLGGTVGAVGGGGGTKGGDASTGLLASGSITVDHDVVGAIAGAGGSGAGGNATLSVGAGGAISVTASNMGALGGTGGTTGGNASVGFLANGDITITGPSPLLAGQAAYGAIGGGSGGKGGDADVTFSSLSGNITVFRDTVAAAGGFSEGGTGGNGTLSFSAAGGIFIHESHIAGVGAFGPSAGGNGTVNLRAGQRIEIIGAENHGEVPQDTTVLASGGSSSTAGGLGAAEIFMEVLAPTGEIVVRNDIVHARGGQLSDSDVFGPASIKLSFPTRATGGFSVNDEDGATIGSLPPGCSAVSPSCIPHGFIINGGNQAAELDLNFFVQYGSSPADERFFSQTVTAMEDIFKTGSNPIEKALDDPGNKKDKKATVCN